MGNFPGVSEADHGLRILAGWLRWVSTAIAAVACLAVPSVQAQEHVFADSRTLSGEVVVFPHRPEWAEAVAERLGQCSLFKVRYIGALSGVMVVQVPEALEDACCAIARAFPGVKSVSRHWGASPGQPFVGPPNDEFFLEQWNLMQWPTPFPIGSSSNCAIPPSTHPPVAGSPSANANVLGAWAYTQGDPRVTIAVIDSGLQLDHPEFVGRVFEPTLNYVCDGPTPPPNDCDPGPAWDNYGHGTGVAGIAMANANNGAAGTGLAVGNGEYGGVAGVDPNCKVLPVRVTRDNLTILYCPGPVCAGTYGVLYTLLALEEIATNPQYSSVRVLNISLHLRLGVMSEEEVAAFEQVVTLLADQGRFVVAISGNFGPGDLNSLWPNQHPRAIAVGGTNHFDQRFDFARGCPQSAVCNASNCEASLGRCCGGPSSGTGSGLDFVAPGAGIRSAFCYDVARCQVCYVHQNAGSCNFNVGTSLAAPFVSGTISLLLARALQLGIMSPLDWSGLTFDDVYGILRDTAVNLDEAPYVGVWDEGHGWGRINVEAAVRELESRFYHCRPDLTATTNLFAWQYGIADGQVNQADWDYYDDQFDALNTQVCDFTTGTVVVPGQPGYGVPDGVLNESDRTVFRALHQQGCG